MSAARGDVLVRLQGIGKDYPKVASGGDRLRTLVALLARRNDGPRFQALDGIDLEVRRGESLGLVGENGAGKSTLLKIIAGIVRPSRGKVGIDGRIGALIELGSGFHPEYTGRENIDLASALAGLSHRETRGKVDEIIAFADIGSHIDEPIKHYSSGMVVRLGFAVATALRPDILITDEILAVGDESFQKKCIAWLERYLADGGTLLLCSHSMFHIQTLCSKALWIHHGQARMQGDRFDVTREYLAYHEEKTRTERTAAARPVAGSNVPRIEELWIERADGTRADVFAKGETLVVQGFAFEPDDRAPVVLVGLVRIDGTPVFGALTNEDGFVPPRIEPTRFGFSLRFEGLPLLPGRYRARGHVLDAQGLRLFDTVEREFTVTGQTRDFGLVELPHAWSAGRGRDA